MAILKTLAGLYTTNRWPEPIHYFGKSVGLNFMKTLAYPKLFEAEPEAIRPVVVTRTQPISNMGHIALTKTQAEANGQVAETLATPNSAEK